MNKSTLNEGLEDFEFVVNYFELPILQYLKYIKHPLTLYKELGVDRSGIELPDDMETHLKDEIAYVLPKLKSPK
jgi:hypothetical protein